MEVHVFHIPQQFFHILLFPDMKIQQSSYGFFTFSHHFFYLVLYYDNIYLIFNKI